METTEAHVQTHSEGDGNAVALEERLPLAVRGLTKSFGGGVDFSRLLPWARRNGRPGWRKNPKRAVDSVSFEIRRGEIFGVIGANGSGKSTLIRIVSTLLLPDAGEVHIFGMHIDRESQKVRALINRVSADPSFFRNMTALENLLFSAACTACRPRRSGGARRRSSVAWAWSGSGPSSR